MRITVEDHVLAAAQEYVRLHGAEALANQLGIRTASVYRMLTGTHRAMHEANYRRLVETLQLLLPKPAEARATAAAAAGPMLPVLTLSTLAQLGPDQAAAQSATLTGTDYVTVPFVLPDVAVAIRTLGTEMTPTLPEGAAVVFQRAPSPKTLAGKVVLLAYQRDGARQVLITRYLLRVGDLLIFRPDQPAAPLQVPDRNVEAVWPAVFYQLDLR